MHELGGIVGPNSMSFTSVALQMTVPHNRLDLYCTPFPASRGIFISRKSVEKRLQKAGKVGINISEEYKFFT